MVTFKILQSRKFNIILLLVLVYICLSESAEVYLRIFVNTVSGEIYSLID